LVFNIILQVKNNLERHCEGVFYDRSNLIKEIASPRLSGNRNDEQQKNLI